MTTRFSLLRGRTFRAHKHKAHALVAARLIKLNQLYGFSYGRVTIRNQKSRWGSCSSKGNLNFNYRLLFLPPALQDYIIAHELCHIQEFNHSSAFWELLAMSIPDCKSLRKILHRLDMRFVHMMPAMPSMPALSAPLARPFSYIYRRI
ncbi:MAG: hypothetical protein QOG91_439 [Candidatus Parcubacteria bacterium]|nr:hypothetical protein [Candidatus Parcubacteria bacterium]